MIPYVDDGLSNVYLRNGFATRVTEYGPTTRYLDLEDMARALAIAITTKPARLSSGEFRWLRKYIELSQVELARLLDRDAQTVSLIERGKRRVPPLFDRELRRAADGAMGLATTNQSPNTAELNEWSHRRAFVKYLGTRDDLGSWFFSVSACAAGFIASEEIVDQSTSAHFDWSVDFSSDWVNSSIESTMEQADILSPVVSHVNVALHADPLAFMRASASGIFQTVLLAH